MAPSKSIMMAALGLPMPKLIIVIPSACAEVILASRPNTGTLNLSAKSSTYLLKLVRRMYSPKSFKLLLCSGKPVCYNFLFVS